MGLKVSCIDCSYLPTAQENQVNSFTDGELTEFQAITSQEIEDRSDPNISIIKERHSNLIVKDSVWEESASTRNERHSAMEYFQGAYSIDSSFRIYSSNAFKEGLKVTNHVKNTRSYCSTNVNSQGTSRCVSPMLKGLL